MMERHIPLKSRYTMPSTAALMLLLALTVVLYYNWSGKVKFSLSRHLAGELGIEASTAIYKDAITRTLEHLALELDIDLEHYDLTWEEYESVLEAARDKFGDCQQYRLVASAYRDFSCYTCTSKHHVLLNVGQTFKIGQTCGGQKTRYGSQLPEPSLKYVTELEGNIFEVLVAEYIKLSLFRSSGERKQIIEQNRLGGQELPLPPGNKILR